MAAHPPFDPQAAPVRRRWVGYLSGFDPQGPAHYHRLYADEAARQSAVGGYALEVGPRHKDGAHVAWWTVHWSQGEQQVHTRYEFLRWDDLVRAEWPRGVVGLLRATLVASLGMWRNGVMTYSLCSAWPAFLALALPGLLLLSALGLAVGFLALGWRLADVVGAPAALGVALLAGGAVLWSAGRLAANHHMAWLMRSAASLWRQGRGRHPDLEARLDGLAQRAAAAVRSGDYDEVLLVGHSSGAMQAMKVAARALRTLGPARAAHPALGLLTLGHCTPLLSVPACASGFRAELQRLLDDPGLCWIDYTAPPDGCCYALVDPSAPCRDDTPSGHRPKLLNPRFASHFSPASYAAIRSDKHRCHFQYLMATELPGSYDYFQLTAGPMTLAQRHARQPSTTGFRQFQLFGLA